MSLLENGAFMDHLEQSKVEAKQQVNSMIDAIYAKVMLDLELWLNKHDRNEANDSVQQLGVDNEINENVNCPPSLHPFYLQSHSNHLSIKREIELNSEENFTEHNLPGELTDWQPTQPEPLQLTHSVTPQTTIVKEEFVYDDEDNQNGEVEVGSRVIQNEQSAYDLGYLQVHNEFCQDTIPNMTNIGFPEFDSYKVSNRLHQNSLSQQPREYSQARMHFEGDFDTHQGTLDKVKREIEEEENMKRKENELETGNTRKDDDGGQIESEQSEAISIQPTIEYDDHGQLNLDESMLTQHNQNDTNNTIEDQIANESTTNPIQPNLAQPNRRFQCPQCPKSFQHKCKLEEHFRVHTDERPFACDQCGKDFRQKVHLTKHQLFHQNIKSFQCGQCDKQFVVKFQLDNHLRTHSGERPFQCRFCDKFFNVASHRKCHEQAIHLHVKPYRCKVCGQSATLHQNIIKHIRVIHFGLPQTIKEQRERNIIDERDPGELVEKV